MSRSHLSLSVLLSLLALVVTPACKSEGSFPGDLKEDAKTNNTKSTEHPGPAKAKHENVEFTWEAEPGGHSGTMKTTLPDGETFTGQFHQLTGTTTVTDLDGFYGSWYGGPWVDGGWVWGPSWDYYETPEEYLEYYTGQTVALLVGDRGTNMRCHFKLDKPDRGMKGGGSGDCQLSNGDRITSVFASAQA